MSSSSTKGACEINLRPHPEDRALARVSKDGRQSIRRVHPSRRLLRKLLRMRSVFFKGDLRDAFEEGLFRRLNRIWSSHMHPHAVEPQSKQPLLLVGGIEHPGQREFARRCIGEQG